jgi:hypothetical protein
MDVIRWSLVGIVFCAAPVLLGLVKAYLFLALVCVFVQ